MPALESVVTSAPQARSNATADTGAADGARSAQWQERRTAHRRSTTIRDRRRESFPHLAARTESATALAAPGAAATELGHRRFGRLARRGLAVFLLAAGSLTAAVFALHVRGDNLPHVEANRTAGAAYATALLQKHPENAALRLTLVRLLIDQGELAAALAALPPIEQFKDEEMRREYLLLRIEVLQKSVSAAPGDEDLVRQLNLALVQALDLQRSFEHR